jgi:V/A-type H+-transporting ATPase subunit D
MRRLRTGRLAADLLDRKLRILRTEQERLERLAAQAGARWRDACRRADEWGLRAAVTGGRRELRLAATTVPAEVTVEWANVMGIRYPVAVTCTVPEQPEARAAGGAATVEAARAYRAAVSAAVAHAGADAARRTVAAETAATRRRLHAITDRWIPRLETALRQRAAQLDETELADTVRLRWAAARHR